MSDAGPTRDVDRRDDADRPADADRRADIDRLVAAGRALVDAGLSPGSSGNLSLRSGGQLLMTGTGTSLGSLGGDDLAVLGADGRPIVDAEGQPLGPRPSKEVALHVALLAKNPAHRAVVHVHSPYAVALSCLEPWADHSAVPPLTPYSLMRLGQVPLLGFVAPGDPAMGDLITDSPHPFRAALLSNHGAVVGAESIEAAVSSAVELEEACRVTLLTQGGARRLIAPEQVRAITASWGTPWTDAAALS
ncbi:class II aldolase/adducin family protein [Frigoribacterium faeni]|uniref:L-fuculose-phosphate aldolase n=1 Tax=Frigoribacterium faeni TaxID=145483 RepID=A0A7W3JJ67_9MICO|nr:class II aldolase/adducin family protein [Frigoribacterium faeni]MBA8813847.1 L-fuculose-phosphate aldolase [Frigoribacterium faeni]BFF15167.1 hypothetical protein GCM10025699_64700 [Microbacterium flavescens]GEK82179.1 hypothetical protein FFA01_04880 [Frigoribacterium faeni]